MQGVGSGISHDASRPKGLVSALGSWTVLQVHTTVVSLRALVNDKVTRYHNAGLANRSVAEVVNKRLMWSSSRDFTHD